MLCIRFRELNSLSFGFGYVEVKTLGLFAYIKSMFKPDSLIHFDKSESDNMVDSRRVITDDEFHDQLDDIEAMHDEVEEKLNRSRRLQHIPLDSRIRNSFGTNSKIVQHPLDPRVAKAVYKVSAERRKKDEIWEWTIETKGEQKCSPELIYRYVGQYMISDA